ncbi:MAG: DNA modification methylase [Bacteroidetes bacterium]|nr:MAG: DNA modification methylase [Bacteroidota bacterium]MBL1145368.1 DNA modification methylase [Bacteroidota bacterium]NOG58166.1 N-6 DNA methylase [Bacteroidota bacterium]
MTVSEIRHILESPYDRKVWKGFLQTQFTNNKLNAEDRVISLSDKTLSKQCLSLGNYEINEYTKIGIFEVELNEKVNITRNRVALRNLLKDLTKQVAGAMVVFVQGDKWRFSYISKRKVKNTATNEIQDKETAPKRYTYLFGKNEKALTAAIRFDKLIQKQQENIFQFLTLDDFEEAFSVEKLSKEFFKNYKEAYEDFVQFLTGKRYRKKGNKYVEQVIHEPDWQLTALFNKDEKQARDFCKRMMGRIVFLYFIQKKGWLAVAKGKKWGEGNPDYLYDLFTKSKHKEDFYHQELVPLFFRTLCNPDYEKANNDFRFPYLNGGLFDDSQDRKYNKLYMPERIFQNLFETFNNYNFTIYEDAPDEHTVAVDPEMLGHIFENLLEDNKDKGAFYTPKEIVHYMCKESLKAYLFAQDENLFGNNELAKQAIDKIIQQQELNDDEKQFAEKNAYKIIGALEQVKVCDPAIGSGAFPMGLLQEIFNALVYLQELKGFKKGVSDADIKKHIIEESIYGVDIDSGAVDIARLRFWLSLVVDEPEPQPLPNLDFKIICANTLIPLGKINELDMDAKASLAVKELEKIRHDFFNVSSEEKLQLERRFKKVQTDLLSLRELTTKDNYDFYTKLYGFNPFDFESAPCSWFDAWWMFGVKEGFDIIIGNPPYVRRTSLDSNLKKQYEKYYKSAYKQYDLYILFIEMGLNNLKKDGILSFINPNKFFVAEYGLKIREIVLTKADVLQIVDLSKCSVFENALTYPILLLIRNNHTNSETSYVQLKNLNEFENIDKKLELHKLFNFNSQFEIIFQSDSRTSNIIDKIEEIKTNIGDYFKCKRGIPNNKIEYVDKGLRAIKSVNVQKYFIDTPNTYIEFKDKSFGSNIVELFKNELLLLPRTVLNIRAAYHNQEDIILDRIYYLQRYGNQINSKYALSILNSQLIHFWFENKFSSTKVQGGYFDLRGTQISQIPIMKFEGESSFETLVDYLIFLYDKEKEQVISHTPNVRVASHIEDVLNMMVYELYFEEHMKEVGIDVLQFISPKPISDLENSKDQEEVIQNFYLWYQKPENPVRQRMLLVETRSKDIIAVINKNIQQ